MIMYMELTPSTIDSLQDLQRHRPTFLNDLVLAMRRAVAVALEDMVARVQIELMEVHCR